MASKTKSVTAENQFTGAITPVPSSNWQIKPGHLNISVSGTWVATVTLQRRFSSTDSWLDVDTFTSNVETYLTEFETGVEYRLGVKTGDFTSGTVECRLSF